ncbi:hypothetical protein FQN57_000902 [Myotisia sp. PD_48]|nr:hypothetical protein FQN57_000902 [Myotisia sp. PD_48]
MTSPGPNVARDPDADEIKSQDRQSTSISVDLDQPSRIFEPAPVSPTSLTIAARTNASGRESPFLGRYADTPVPSPSPVPSPGIPELSTNGAESSNLQQSSELQPSHDSALADGVVAKLASTPFSLRQKFTDAWQQGKGMAMVMLSQLFGASMNVMTRVLELDGPHGPAMHPFQILFVRMGSTVLCSAIYMWYTKVPYPLGAPGVRLLLVARGTTGFVGVACLYYSLMYLPLSEATALTFLAPIFTCYACSFVIPGETFTRKQQLAGLISFLGVLLISKPFSIFSGSSSPSASPEGDMMYNGTALQTSISRNVSSGADASPDPDFEHHLMAVGIALVGVLGATSAYTCIRKIGKRAHPLVSVNYFGMFSTLVSFLGLVISPSINFRLPSNATEILLFTGLGVCGFLLQFLLTAGLSYVPPPRGNEKASSHGSRATSMVYLQMLFALFYDKVVWNSTPSVTSLTGSGIILGCALYVALATESSIKDNKLEPTTEDNPDRRGVQVFPDIEEDINSNPAPQRKWSSQDEQMGDHNEAQRLLSSSYDDNIV